MSAIRLVPSLRTRQRSPSRVFALLTYTSAMYSSYKRRRCYVRALCPVCPSAPFYASAQTRRPYFSLPGRVISRPAINACILRIRCSTTMTPDSPARTAWDGEAAPRASIAFLRIQMTPNGSPQRQATLGPVHMRLPRTPVFRQWRVSRIHRLLRRLPRRRHPRRSRLLP